MTQKMGRSDCKYGRSESKQGRSDSKKGLVDTSEPSHFFIKWNNSFSFTKTLKVTPRFSRKFFERTIDDSTSGITLRT